MALTVEQLFSKPTKSAIKQVVLDTAEAFGLPVTSWIFGDPAERFIEIFARVVDGFFSTQIVQQARGYFFDYATDPGDAGDLSADQTPREGWLSQFGEGFFGTTRRGQTFATTLLTITNDNAGPVTFSPGDITVERNYVDTGDGGTPRYFTTEDDSIYTNPDGSVTLASGASRDFPIQAEILGTYSGARADTIAVLVTGSFGSLTVTNAAPALATEREAANDYRTRARRATSRVATGGPSVLYIYAANTDLDGNPLQRHDGSGVVGITRVFVDDGLTEGGQVVVYVADDDGAADAVDVASANANITGIPLGVITEPYGVVCGVATYSTQAATNHSIHVAGSVKIKAGPGITTTVIKDAILAALAEYFRTLPINGSDASGSGGFVYTTDLEGVVRDAYPGIYKPTITTPATASTALALGEVATLNSVAADWLVVIT